MPNFVCEFAMDIMDIAYDFNRDSLPQKFNECRGNQSLFCIRAKTCFSFLKKPLELRR